MLLCPLIKAHFLFFSPLKERYVIPERERWSQADVDLLLSISYQGGPLPERGINPTFNVCLFSNKKREIR
jgi:hypothetical protein